MYAFGQQVTRERRIDTVDPYDSSTVIPGSWEGALDVLPLEGCYVDFGASSSVNDATRSPVSTTTTLFCPDPTVDVKVGDRIRVGADVWYVNERPAGYINPFTGWAPPLEVPLDLNEG